MQLKIYPDYETLSSAAADKIIECIKNKPDAVLCFATGDSPRRAYQLLPEKIKATEVDFEKCFIIGLDEWLGIPPATSGTCHHFLHKYLIDPLKLDPSRIHLFDALAKNPGEECEKMNGVIEKLGGIDFMLVGVGMNGHIGFNEPGTPLETTAHVAMLDNTTRTVGKKYFETEVPITKGITLGMKQVLESRALLMLANGKKKAPVIRQALEKEIDINFPASFIRSHKKGIMMLDTEAASELETALKSWQNN